MRRLRPFAIAVLILIVLDIVLRSSLLPWFPDDYRMPRVSTIGYTQYLEWMQQRDTVRIAVVGDSVIQGIAVERDGTLPAQWDALYAARNEPVDVFNFGISAAHAEDFYPVVATIANRKAADMVVVYFDYPFYEADAKPYSGRYPELWDPAVVGSFEPHTGEPLVDPTRSDPGTLTLDARIGQKVCDLWAFYGERDYVNAVLFDGTPSSWLKYHVNYQYGRFSFLPQWVKLRTDQFDEKNLHDMWKTPLLTEDNVQLTYLRLAIEKAAAEDLPFVLVWGPINEAVVAEYDLIDPADYEANRTLVRELVQRNGGTFVDMADGFPQADLADSVHPFESGYAFMADRLTEELAPAIDDLVAGGDAR